MRCLLLAAGALLAAAQSPSPTPNPPPVNAACVYQPDGVPGITFNVCNLASAQE